MCLVVGTRPITQLEIGGYKMTSPVLSILSDVIPCSSGTEEPLSLYNQIWVILTTLTRLDAVGKSVREMFRAIRSQDPCLPQTSS